VLDAEVQEAIERDSNALVSWYLIASYAYYELGTSILSDGFFDAMAVQLYESYSSLKHPHLSLIDRESVLVSGAFTPTYPRIVKHIAGRLTPNAV